MQAVPLTMEMLQVMQRMHAFPPKDVAELKEAIAGETRVLELREATKPGSVSRADIQRVAQMKLALDALIMEYATGKKTW